MLTFYDFIQVFVFLSKITTFSMFDIDIYVGVLIHILQSLRHRRVTCIYDHEQRTTVTITTTPTPSHNRFENWATNWAQKP